MTAMPTKRRGNAMLAVIAVIVLVIIAAVVYFIMNKPKASGLMAEGLKMAPATTQIFFAADLGSMYDEKTQQEMIAAFKDSKMFKSLAEEMKAENLDIDADVLSWVKPEMVIAAFPLDGKPSIFSDPESSGDAPPFGGFMVVGVRDDAKAKAGVEKLMTKAGEKIKFKTEDYKGAKIWTPEKGVEDGPTLALAPGKLILGIKDTDVKGALDGAAQSLGSAPGYTNAMKSIKHQSGMIFYGDLQGMLKAAESEMKDAPPEVKKLVDGLRTIAGGTGKDGKDLVSDFMLSIDPAVSGKLASFIFKPAYGIDMKSAEYYPADTELYGSLNLKMIWQMAYDIMGEFPETAPMRDYPAQALQQQGIDFQKDLLDPLTGELGYSIQGYSKMLSSQLQSISSGNLNPDPSAQMQELATMPVVLTLGLANKAKLEELINKQIPEPARAMFQKQEHNGVTIYGIQGQFFYALTEDFMLVGINKADDVMKKMIDAKKDGKNIKSLPGYGRLMGQLGSEKPVYLAYVDAAKIYGQAGNDIAKDDPGMAKFLQLMFRDYTSSWQAGTLRADGLFMSGVLMGK